MIYLEKLQTSPTIHENWPNTNLIDRIQFEFAKLWVPSVPYIFKRSEGSRTYPGKENYK